MNFRSYPKKWRLVFIIGILGILFIWYIYNARFIIFLEENRVNTLKIKTKTLQLYSADNLPKWDFTTLANMDEFQFLTMNAICIENEPLLLLVVIHTAPQNLNKRNAIRETWGSPRKDLKILYMLGAVDDPKVQNDLDREDHKHHDLIQGNFRDSYRNLTYKHVMALKYVVYLCPFAKFILKGDDDIYVNIPFYIDYVNKLAKFDRKKFILCDVLETSPAIRQKSKWQVSFEEYPHSIYPVYCSGYAVLYSYDTVFSLYKEAQRGEYFWIDDVHVTGTLAKRINLRHTPLSYSRLDYTEMETYINSNGTKGREDFLYGPLNIDVQNIYKLWAALSRKLSDTRKFI